MFEQRGEVAEGARGDGVGALDETPTGAPGAGLEVLLLEGAPHALAGHLEDAELADREDRAAGAVALQAFAEPVLDLLAVRGAHVDQVVDDQPAQVAEAELPADLVDGLEVGLEGVGLGVAGGAALARVDIDRDEGLGLLDDQRPPLGRGPRSRA